MDVEVVIYYISYRDDYARQYNSQNDGRKGDHIINILKDWKLIQMMLRNACSHDR